MNDFFDSSILFNAVDANRRKRTSKNKKTNKMPKPIQKMFKNKLKQKSVKKRAAR